MRKLSKSILICAILCATTMFFVGCGCSKEIKVNRIEFEKPNEIVFVGEEFEPNALILPYNATNQKVLYRVDNPQLSSGAVLPVLEKVEDKKFVARSVGQATITAYSIELGTRVTATQTVQVFPNKIKLNSPIGLKFDGSKVLWDKSQYQLSENFYDAYGYVVSVNDKTSPVTTNTYFEGLEAGVENIIKVKAVGNSNKAFDDSDYTSEIKVYILESPKGVQRVGNTFSWEAVDFASSYNVLVNGEPYITNVTGLSAQIDFEAVGNHAVSVVANPEINSEYKYPSRPSETISVEKLDKVSTFSIANNVASWNEIVKALEYKVIFEQDGEQIFSYNTGVHTSMNLNEALGNLECGEYDLSVVAISNTSSGLNSNKSELYRIVKLGKPTNLKVVNNSLTWREVENATNYALTVDDSAEQVVNLENGFTLDEELGAGTYKIKMKAIGDGSRYFDSDWLASSEAFSVVKLKAPESISNLNNTIKNELIDKAKGYKYYDFAGENVYEFTADDVIGSSLEGDLFTTTLTLQDKVTLEQARQNLFDTSNFISIDEITDEMAYYHLQSMLNENKYSIKVKSVAIDNENYFDSNVSEVSVDFHKLFAPNYFNIIFAKDMFVYSCALDLLNVLLKSPASYQLYQDIDLLYDTQFIANIRYQQMEGNKLVDRFIHRLDGTTDGITDEENALVEGGDIYISLSFCGNGTSVIDSDYYDLKLAETWAYDTLTESFPEYIGTDKVLTSSNERVVVGKVYVPEQITMRNSTLKFTSKDNENVIFKLFVIGVDGMPHEIYSGEEKSIDLSNLIDGSGRYFFKLIAKPTDNQPYESETVDHIEKGTATLDDKYRFSSNVVDLTIDILKAPQISINNGYIQWTSVEGASGYGIYVNDVLIDNPQIIEESNLCKWRYDNLTTAELNIKVKALAPVMNVASTELVMDSDFSNEIENLRLVIDGYQISNDTFTATTSEPNVHLVLRAFNTLTRETKEIVSSGLSLDLCKEIGVGGDYYLSFFITLNGGVTQDKLDSIVWGADYTAQKIDITVLENPTITYNEENYKLSWHAVNGATAYKVAYRVVGSENVGFSEAINALEVDLSVIPNLIGNTNYEITIISVGNAEKVVSSLQNFETNAIEFTRLKVIENLSGQVSGDNFVLTWDAMENVNYDVYLNNEFKENVSTNTYQIALSELTNVGTYSFAIRTLAIDNSQVPSTYSTAFTTTRLESPSVSIVNGNIVIANYDAEYGEILLQVEKSTPVFVDNFTTATISLDDIVELDEGEYTFKITFLGTGTKYLTSEVTIITEISRVDQVTGLKLNGGTLSLDFNGVSGVAQYKVVFNKGTGNEQTFTISTTSFVIPSDLPAGENTAVVYAISNDPSKVNALASATLEFEKLATPLNCEVQNGKLVFNQVPGVTNYEIYTDKNGQIIKQNFVYSASGFELDLEDVGVYNISVCAKGNYSNEISGKTINSSYSSAIQIIKFGEVENIAVVNNTLTWDNVDFATTYKLIFSGAGNYEKEISTNSYVIERDVLTAGKYNLQIFALGDGEATLSGRAVNVENVFEILQAPTNIALTASKNITWDAVTSAVNYTCLVEGNGYNNLSNVTTNKFEIPTNLPVGTFTIKVMSLGNGQTLVDSKNSVAFSFTKLQAPSAVAHKSGDITVTQVASLENYTIKITKPNGQVEYINADTTNFKASYAFEDVGEYDICAISAGNYSTTIDSNCSHSIKVRRLAEQVLRISDDTIYWQNDEFVNLKRFGYNLIIEKDSSVVFDDVLYETSKSFNTSSLTNGNYRISVQSLAGEEIEFLPSEIAQLSSIVKFNKPTINNSLVNNKVVWTVNVDSSIQNFIIGFEVKISKENEQDKFVVINNPEIKEFELDANYESGEYLIYVRVLGDGQTYISSQFSEPKQVTKLSITTPYIERQDKNNSTSSYVAKWESEANATSYLVTFNGTRLIETDKTYIVLDDVVDIEAGLNTIQVQAVGNNNNYVNSNLSSISSFEILDNTQANLRIENGIIAWDSVANTKIYQLKINETYVNCNNNSYELPSTFNSGNISICIKLIANDSEGTQNVIINSNFSNVKNGYKLATPSAPSIITGQVRLGVVDYQNVEEEFENTLYYEVEYGDYKEILALDKNESMIFDFYSNRINIASTLRYRAIGDSYNLNSSWTSNLADVNATQLPTPENVRMENGVLMWDEVHGASKYCVYGVLLQGDEVTDVSWETYVSSTSLEKPFYDSALFDETGASLAIGVMAVGSEEGIYIGVPFTNSKLLTDYTVTYLQKANEIQTKNGVLTWTGNSYYGYELLVNGNNSIIINENTYSLDEYDAGELQIKIRLRGDNNAIVSGAWSDEVIAYKMQEPEEVDGQIYLSDGKVTWRTNAGFIASHPTKDIQQLGIFRNAVFELTNTVGGVSRTVAFNHVETILDGGYYVSIWNDYFDNFVAGTYSIRVKNLGNNGIDDNSRFISSILSNNFIASILPTAQNVRVEGGVLRWSNVENNNGYLVTVGKQNGETVTVDIPRTQTSDGCKLDLRDYEVGKYSLSIRTIGDSENYLTSRNTNAVLTEVLACPSQVGVEEGVLAWTTIEGAISYNVKVETLINPASTEFINVTVETVNGKDYYELPESLQAGAYKVWIMANGDNSNYITSKYMETPKIVTKLEAVDYFGNTQGKLSWHLCMQDSQAITGYKIEIISEESNAVNINEFVYKAYTVPTEGSPAQIEVIDGVCYYELPSNVPAGALTIKVKALGDNIDLVNSSFTNNMVATKLAPIDNMYIHNGVIAWSYDGIGHLGFNLIVGDGATAITYNELIKVYEREFPSELPAGEYNTYMKAVGNTVDSLSSSARYLSSNTSRVLRIVKLAQVAEFVINDGMLVWDEVSRASAYELKFFKEGQTAITVITSQYDRETNKFFYKPLTEGINNFTSGLYSKITIRALGGTTNINSQPIEMNNIIKLEKTNSVEVIPMEETQELKLKWQIVSYTSGEKIYVKKYGIRIKDTASNREIIRYVSYDDFDIIPSQYPFNDSTFFECDINDIFDLGTGNYLLSIQACALPVGGGGGTYIWNTINSDFSSEVAITKPETPTNLRYDNAKKAFVWNKPNVNSELSVEYLVSYKYRENETTSSYTYETYSTNETYFYPEKLGIYAVVVKAIVSGSMSSDYIAVNNITFISKKNSLTGSGEVELLQAFIDGYGATCKHFLFSSGSGTLLDPYRIANITQFRNLEYYNQPNMYFTLSADINANGENLSISKFSGNLDGNDKTIRNVTLNASNKYIGIFASVFGATIENLKVENTTTTITRNQETRAGLLIGYAENVTLTNIATSGSITQNGTNNATFHLGGVVGSVVGDDIQITNVRNYASITSGNVVGYVGGIAGWLVASDGFSTTISNLGNEGNITGTIAGGIVGFGECNIDGAYNHGTIVANSTTNMTDYAGGIAGQFTTNFVCIISNVYNTGNVTANSTDNRKTPYAGGIAGKGSVYVENFYNSGIITTNKSGSSEKTAGWLIGESIASFEVVNSYNINSNISQPVGKGATPTIYASNPSASDLLANVNEYLGEKFEAVSGNIILTMEYDLITI